MLTADVLLDWIVRLLSSCDQILALQDQMKVEGILFQEHLAEVVPGLDRGHVERSEPFESRASQTPLEQVDKLPFISLKLCEVFAIRPQMGNKAAHSIVLLKPRDVEVLWQYRL